MIRALQKIFGKSGRAAPASISATQEMPIFIAKGIVLEFASVLGSDSDVIKDQLKLKHPKSMIYGAFDSLIRSKPESDPEREELLALRIHVSDYVEIDSEDRESVTYANSNYDSLSARIKAGTASENDIESLGRIMGLMSKYMKRGQEEMFRSWE